MAILGLLCAGSGCELLATAAATRAAIGPRPPPAACYAADAVYTWRTDGNGTGKHPAFLGLRSLDGPVACPLAVGKIDLPELPTLAGHVLSATPADTWQSKEQDKLRDDEIAYTTYHYRAYKIVIGVKMGGDFSPLAADEWPVSEVLGTPPADVLVGTAPLPGGPQWMDHLGEVRPVFERFYRSHHLAERHTEKDNNWAELDILACFEALGHNSACGAENAGQLHTRAVAYNPYPAAAFCAGYGHLHHPKLGGCHTAGNVNAPGSKCMFTCMDNQNACVARTGDPIACATTASRCEQRCD
jgi:hypothetical protein